MAPDFVALYGHGEGDLTPRMAAQLWMSVDSIKDQFADGSGELWLPRLPRIAQVHRDDEFDERFGARFEVLAERLFTGEWSASGLVSCTADEIALDIGIDYAEDCDDCWDTCFDWFIALPHHPEDHDYDNARDLLFEDFDFQLLYNPALDGIEDPDGPVDRQLHFAWLHPRDWFRTFRE